MKRLLHLIILLAALLTPGAPAAHADGGACPPWERGCSPAPEGGRVALPGGSRVDGAAAEELQTIVGYSRGLDGRRVIGRDLAGRGSDHRPMRGDAWEIRPIDQRWPHAGRNWLVQE